MRKIGKIGRRNIQANKILREKLGHKTRCEIKLDGCLGGMFLQFCHRHERHWYRTRLKLLSEYNQVIVGCTSCHEQMDNKPKLREQIFLALRGKENVG